MFLIFTVLQDLLTLQLRDLTTYHHQDCKDDLDTEEFLNISNYSRSQSFPNPT